MIARLLLVLPIVLLFAHCDGEGPGDSPEAKAKRVCYWDCVRRAKCRTTLGSCCICKCSLVCDLIKSGCPECPSPPVATR